MPGSVTVRVAAAVIEDDNGAVLIAKRPAGRHQGGKWEFPGGKIEQNETEFDALVRELKEELDIRVVKAERLIAVSYRYPEKDVLLDVWRVRYYEGEPKGLEGQEIRWVDRRELGHLYFPPANRAIVAALTLPDIYAISDGMRYGESRFLELLQVALESGLRLLQLREHGLSRPDYLALARRVIDLSHRYQAKVLLNCDPAWLGGTGADGIHLTESRLRGLVQRPVAPALLVAASCHDAESLRHAERTGADFAVLSPVSLTDSHPGVPALGWRRFQELCLTTSLPVYALGGMQLRDRPTARRHGAQGIALIRGLWGLPDIGDPANWQDQVL